MFNLPERSLNSPYIALKNVGIYLLSPVFSHSQLYVAISRVTSRDELKILITDEDDQDTYVTSNVVYHKVFRNV
jgi:ATP-dependent DNA helicase PIF1